MSVFRKILGTYQMNNLMLDSVSYFVTFWSLLCYLVLTLSLYHIETSLLIYSGNQWTSFYITEVFVIKELNLYAKMTIIFAIKLITNKEFWLVSEESRPEFPLLNILACRSAKLYCNFLWNVSWNFAIYPVA